MENSDRPAMPQNYDLHVAGMGLDASSGQGLTKREHFAGLAMQAVLASGTHGNLAMVSKNALQFADALLAELEK